MDKQILQLFKKYLDDRCTPEELDQVRGIWTSDQYEEEWAAVLGEEAERCMDEEALPSMEKRRSDRLLDRVCKSAGIEKRKSVEQSPQRLRYAVAASILLLVTAGLTLLTIYTMLESGDEVEVVTKAGEQTEVLLPDGSRVRLNDESTLRYAEEFEGNARTVHLEGKAFFEVASNPSSPFFVETGALTIRVLGTEFDVSAYDSDRDMSVTVAEGSVSVSGPSSVGETSGSVTEEPEKQIPTRLKSGDQLIYDRYQQRYLRQTMSLTDIAILHRGGLVFHNKSLEDIARALERRYEVTIRFEEATLKQQRLTFKPNSDSLHEVLQVLSLVSGLEYEQKDGEVIMSKE